MAARRGAGGCLRALALAAVLALAGWLLRERALAALGGFLVVADPPAAADAILVLSGDPAERVWEAADLHREGWAPRIVLTTPRIPPAAAALAARGVDLPEEPQIARRVALGLGVAPAALLQLPAPVNSTEAEALAFRAFAGARGWRRVIVVSSPYHTRRVQRLFREVLEPAGIETLVLPSRHAQFSAGSWWRDRDSVRSLVIEYQKLLFYALPGHER